MAAEDGRTEDARTEDARKMVTATGPDISMMLRQAKLRPTKQRLALGSLLFAEGHRHVTAEMLHEEAIAHRIPVSLATVYNTLHQFTKAGLLREVAADGSRAHFDTNISDHHHFFVEEEDVVLDIPAEQMALGRLPIPPDGTEVVRVDVVIRVRRVAAKNPGEAQRPAAITSPAAPVRR